MTGILPIICNNILVPYGVEAIYQNTMLHCFQMDFNHIQIHKEKKAKIKKIIQTDGL